MNAIREVDIQIERNPHTASARVAGSIAIGAAVSLTPPDGQRFDVKGKAAVVLAQLALEGQADRRRLAQMLWPDSPESQARNNLRTLVHRLNQRFGDELLVGTERLSIDRGRVQVMLQGTDALLDALSRSEAQRCELLGEAGLEVEAGDALGSWLDGARQRLRQSQLSGLCEALAEAMQRGHAERAIALARACVQLEPLSEQWHRQLMDTLAQCGDRAAALAAYEDCKQRLLDQLGVLPDVQTRSMHLRILQGQAGEQDAAGAPAQPVVTGLTPLGACARYPLVEREEVLAEVEAALAQRQHLVLQGEAGVGKTRLLMHLSEHYALEQVAIRPGARDEPYSAVAQLLHEVQPRRAARIGAREQLELARLAPLAFPDLQPSPTSPSAPWLHAALRHWARRLAQSGVQRLVIDDVHYADTASQAAFGALLADPDSAGALPLILARRTDEIDPALEEALVAAQVNGRARCITLPRLSLRGVRELLETMHTEHSEVEVEWLLQHTGGNPLFVIELAQHTLEKGDEAASTSGNLEALLRSRLAACSTAAQQLAAIASVAAGDFSVELAAAVTRQQPLALMPAWSELQQRGLFADHGLAHDLVRAASLATLPKAIRNTLHRQVAECLERLGLRGRRVVRHWMAAGAPDGALRHTALLDARSVPRAERVGGMRDSDLQPFDDMGGGLRDLAREFLSEQVCPRRETDDVGRRRSSA